MGKYWATWSGQNEEGYYINYELEFFEEIDGKLEAAFNLSPRIQLNERMGNVAEPSTRHTLTKDIYTHVTYADLRTDRGQDHRHRGGDARRGTARCGLC